MVAKGVWHKVKCRECGKDMNVPEYKIRIGHGKYCSKSCSVRATGRKHGHTTKSWQSRTYNSWAQMRARCTNPNNPKFYLYGGRGISVCDRWLDFSEFLNDMGERPDGTTLDRIDGTKGYYPGNCRWAQPFEQSANTIQVKHYNLNGRLFTARELAELSGVNKRTMLWRIKNWPEDRWLEPPHN